MWAPGTFSANSLRRSPTTSSMILSTLGTGISRAARFDLGWYCRATASSTSRTTAQSRCGWSKGRSSSCTRRAILSTSSQALRPESGQVSSRKRGSPGPRGPFPQPAGQSPARQRRDPGNGQPLPDQAVLEKPDRAGGEEDHVWRREQCQDQGPPELEGVTCGMWNGFNLRSRETRPSFW